MRRTDMNKTHVLPLLLLVCAYGCAAIAWAQPQTRDGAPPQDTVFFNVAAAPLISFSGPLNIVGGAGSVPGAVVTGKPYSADSITESTQMLADGNRITQRNQARVFRDSQGRTRLEQTLGSLGAGAAANEPVTLININDPVAEASYTLDPKTQTARQFRPFRLAAGAASWSPAAAASAEPGAQQSVSDVRATVRGGAVGAEPFDFPLPPPLRSGGGIAQMMPAAPYAGVQSTTFIGPFASAAEDLGDQIIEGLLVHGTRQTQTIDALLIGNERAIEIVAEHWYSADIEATVLRRNFDPRFGETVYRLVNVVRGEPSPDLFAVPQGYDLLVEPAPEIGLRQFTLRPTPEGLQHGERGVFFAPGGATESQD
jgi:hypothetical protein